MAKAFDNESNYTNVDDKIFTALGNALASSTLSKPEAMTNLAGVVSKGQIAGASGHRNTVYLPYSVRDRRINFPSRISIVPTPEPLRYSAR